MHAQDLDQPDQEIKTKRKRRTEQTHPWYKRYPADFYKGTLDLDHLEYAVYSMLVDWMYELSGPIPYSEAIIAHHVRLSPQKWRVMRKRLLHLEKIFVERGGLFNHRAKEVIAERIADEAVDNYDDQPQLPFQVGVQGGGLLGDLTPDHSGKKVIDINERRTQRQSQIQKEREDSKREAQPDSKRGTRLPPDWGLSEDMKDWTQINLSPNPHVINSTLEKFRDYWIARPGQGGLKLDWDATWRNWCRREAKGGSSTRTNRPSRRSWTGRPSAKETFSKRFDVHVEDLQ